VSRSEQRRQAREGGSGTKKLYIAIAIVAVLGVAGVGLSVQSGGSAVTAPVAVDGLDDMEHLVEVAQGVTRGDPDAPVTIVEFGDYQCPACQAYATQVKPQVDLAFVESGRAKFIFYDFPIIGGHRNAFLAARAARCAGDQERYWEYHDNLFRMQARWSPMTNPIDTFVEYAETVGADGSSFRSCLESDRHAELVTANMYLGEQLGVQGTPTILINYGAATRRVGYDFESIRSMIEDVLESGEGA